VLVVTSPLAGTVFFESAPPAVGTRTEKGQNLLDIKPLLPIPRDLHTNAQADVAAALTRFETAKQRAERAANMLRDRVGSERAKEEAEEAVKLTETELGAARIRLGQIETAPLEGDVSVRVSAPQDGIVRQMNVAPQQVVSAGTPLFEIVRLDPVWVRTPVYSGDLSDLQWKASAVVRPINAVPGSQGRLATPVAAPPTADPLSSTTDLYFQLANASLSLHPGEKVSVSMPMRGDKECLQVPYASILIDMQGGTWVYEQTEPLAYRRRRVLVDAVAGQEACLAQGLRAGALVVTDGAAELFGEEFGVGH
jgi:RND family efflux transporter MFP subunit